MSNFKNWWVNDSGINLLKGVEGDPQNPIILGDDLILDFYHRIPQARIDMEAILPSMSPAEKLRIKTLLAHNPIATAPWVSESEQSEAFMRKMNTAGVHTAGPGGGTGKGRLPR